MNDKHTEFNLSKNVKAHRNIENLPYLDVADLRIAALDRGQYAIMQDSENILFKVASEQDAIIALKSLNSLKLELLGAVCANSVSSSDDLRGSLDNAKSGLMNSLSPKTHAVMSEGGKLKALISLPDNAEPDWKMTLAKTLLEEIEAEKRRKEDEEALRNPDNIFLDCI